MSCRTLSGTKERQDFVQLTKGKGANQNAATGVESGEFGMGRGKHDLLAS